jgi:hypothetical protein
VDADTDVATESAPSSHDSFDPQALLELIDGLERDVALIEAAMVDVEERDFPAARAALDVLDAAATA